MYYQNDTDDTWPFLQLQHRLALAKHADANDKLEDTKCRGVTEESDSTLDITRNTPPEEGQKPLVFHGLTQTEHHNVWLPSTPKDQQHPRHTGKSKVVLYIGPENWILTGSTAS